jgi:omega-hydroxy-beta-dihydromenaquinone-9 sulfotransferase
MIHPPPSSAPERPTRPEAWWAPLYQTGSSLRTWLGLLGRNAGRIHRPSWLLLPLVTALIVGGSVLSLVQRLLMARAVKQRPMAGPPLFVLGHWRSGTTLLHELITLDERFAFPSNYECFQPGHFLLTSPLMHRLSGIIGAHKRPMDDMKTTLTSPGEDEAALRNLGAMSFYNNLIFPSRAADPLSSLDLDSAPPQLLARWKRLFHRYLQELNFRHGRPLVLKSPTRTAHVKPLLDLYPQARFVNIIRDPREVHPSAMRMWRSMLKLLCLEIDARVPEELVFASHRLLHRKLKEALPMIPAGQFYEVRFEDLVRDPMGEMERLYTALDLGDFTSVTPRIEAYFSERAEVRARRYELPPEQLARIESELAEVISDNGYGTQT